MRNLYEFLTESKKDKVFKSTGCLLCDIGKVMDMPADERKAAVKELAADINDNAGIELDPDSAEYKAVDGDGMIIISNDDGAEVFSCKRICRDGTCTYIWDGPAEMIAGRGGIEDMLDEYDITGKYCDEHGNVTDEKPDEGTDAWICATDTCK